MLKIETKLDQDGKITIPEEYRRATGLQAGDTVIILLENRDLNLIPLEEAIKRAQALVRRYIPPGRILSEELIRERRAEAANE